MGVFIVTSSLKGVYFCVEIRIKNIFIFTATQQRTNSLTIDGLETKSFTLSNSHSCDVMTELQNCK